MNRIIFNLQLFADITNTIDNTVVSGTSSADSIYNGGDYVTINSGAGNDTIYTVGSNATINSGAGDDSIYNAGYYATMYAGVGADYIENYGYEIIINAGDGEDTIHNHTTDNIVNGGEGNNFVLNYNERVTITTGNGNDFISNNGRSNLIVTGSGDDTIWDVSASELDDAPLIQSSGDLIFHTNGYGKIKHASAVKSSVKSGNTTYLYTKDGATIELQDSYVVTSVDDLITVKYGNGTVDGAGVTIDNKTANTLISGTAYADSIKTFAMYVTVEAGDGDDTIVSNCYRTTIDAGTGDDYIKNGVSYVSVSAGDGNDTIVNDHIGACFVSIVSGNGNDYVENLGSTVLVDTSDGDDYVENSGKNVTIISGDGNDSIGNGGDNTRVDVGSGNDSIRNAGNYSTIYAGDGNDYIWNDDFSGTNSVINGGAGNDTIDSLGVNMTISGDKGNDVISTTGSYGPSFIKYANGDGNDTVYGFNSDDTLNITSGSYTTTKSGSDLIVKVGTGAITLKDVNKANIETVAGHIVWTASGTTATGKIDGKVVATITGLKKGFKADSISDSGSVISISQDALGNAAVKLTKGNYTLALANDVEESVKTLAHWNVDGSSATYRSLDITKGYTVATNGKSITYVSKATVGKDLTTIEGLSENVTADDLTLKGKVVTVKANALGTDEATISNGYTFALDTDVTKSTTTKAFWTIDDDSAEYTNAKVTEGYVLSKDKKSITHNEAGGGELVATVDGLKKGTKANAFSVKNNVITVAKTALNPKNIITLDSEDYTLAIGGGAKKSVTSPEGWYISGTTASYNTEKTTAGYALFDDSKTIEYISEVDGGDTLVKLTGLKSKTKAAALSIKNKVVTIGEDAINVKTAMTATAEGYEIKLSSAGKITAKSENMTLTGSSGNDTLLGSKYADVLKGNGGEDYLSGGNGADKIYGDGDDTLIGGLGKDSLYATAGDNTLTGGSSADEFYFKAGNALITDYTAGTDKIYLQGTSITKTEVNGKNVIFTTSAGTITVKSGANKKITVDDVTQKYSASSSGLFAEDNFFTVDSLSSIVENNSVGEFEFNSSENLTQENLITYADK